MPAVLAGIPGWHQRIANAPATRRFILNVMSTRKTVIRNMLANTGGHLVTMVTMFLLMPFVVHRLGSQQYGLWVLIASFTGWFRMLDLGVRSALGRFVAFHRARNDQDGMNEAVSTAMAILCACGVLVLLSVAGVLVLFFHVIEVPIELYPTVRAALAISGLTLAISYPMFAFEGVLCGCQRYDLINLVSIPESLIRAGLVVFFIGRGHGLVAFALIMLCSTVTTGTAKAVLAFRENADLRVRPRHITRSAARSLFGYGVWTFVASIGRMTRELIPGIVIGRSLGSDMVTVYAVADRLPTQERSLIINATGVLLPVATEFHARDERSRQWRLMLAGARLCAMLTLFILIPFMLLGRPLISLWMGGDFLHAATLLMILAPAEALELTQTVTSSILLGMARIKEMAILELIAGALVLALSVLVAGKFGLVGVCVVVASVKALTRGVLRMWFGCRVLQMPVRQYLAEGLWPPLLASLPSALVLAACVLYRPPASWISLFCYGGLYAACYACSMIPLVGWDQVKLYAGRAWREVNAR